MCLAVVAESVSGQSRQPSVHDTRGLRTCGQVVELQKGLSLLAVRTKITVGSAKIKHLKTSLSCDILPSICSNRRNPPRAVSMPNNFKLLGTKITSSRFWVPQIKMRLPCGPAEGRCRTAGAGVSFGERVFTCRDFISLPARFFWFWRPVARLNRRRKTPPSLVSTVTLK